MQRPEQPEDRPEPLWRHLVGEQLRLRRTGREETLRQVARRAVISPQYLSELERGRKEPSSELLAAVVRALDLSLLDLSSSVADRLAADRLAAGGRRGDVRLAA